MQRSLIVFYTVIVMLIFAGRHAWQTCQWEWISSVSAVAVIVATLIGSWDILMAKPSEGGSITLSGPTLSSVQISILLLCLGTFVAGFGNLFGKWAFGCAG